MSEPTKALHIPRTALITRLKEVKAEAEAKRQEATEKQKAERQAVLDAVAKFTPDQVANMIDHFYGFGNVEIVKWVEDQIDRNCFVSKELEPTAVETTLEKSIRVLELANDTDIEVRPTEQLYAYL